MARGMTMELYVHGPCLICREALTEPTDIVLLEKRGHFLRFGDDGAFAMPDVSLSWTHAAHLN